MRKIYISILAICSIFALTISSSNIKATVFEGNESKYIKLCSSNISSSNKKVCQEFNDYLSEKNEDYEEQISDLRKQIEETNDNLEEVQSSISDLDNEIEEKNEEIGYLEESISVFQSSIDEKEDKLGERLYLMQSTYNSNWIIDFLWGSEDFTTFFSRLSGVNEITSYENELIQELVSEKEELDVQKKSLENAKETLEAQQETLTELQDTYVELKAQQEQQLSESQEAADEYSNAQAKVDAALDALISYSPSTSGGSYVAGDSSIGNAIAQAALSKLGCRYWWGQSGPNYFDCSGLVYWAHNAAGVSIGRSSASGYAGSGISISYSQLQAGDIITFSYGSGIEHVGIYIGGGSFVHASGSGSGTTGQYANQCVKTSSLSGYWQNHVYNYRR
ncbi:MAG: NlpC/P60 family protein, partial [Erysipelotrichaceae bacterium]|nr:NlpC/P60 family protein [Erysipelotrichaceae bacterium]